MYKDVPKNAGKAWLTAALMTGLMWLFAACYSDIHFAVNDDQFILRAFMGFEPGGAPTFHLYIHGLYAYPLRWLSLLCPGVAWFSILQIGLMSLALCTVVKSVLTVFWRRGRSYWTGFLFGLCYLILYGLYYCARVTYTTTAATLGAAAVAQILSVDCENGRDGAIVRGMAYALALVVLCYGLRQMTALPVLCYCGLALCLRFCQHFGWGKGARRSLKPLLITLCAVAVVMGGLAAGRELEITGKGQRDYLDWQQARISVLDYIDLTALPPEAVAGAGLTQTENDLLILWNTMDEAVSTSAFRYLRENWYNDDTTYSAGMAVQDFRLRSSLMIFSMAILTALGAGCLLMLRRRKGGLWLRLALWSVGLGSFAFFCYLALQGRLPYRAVTVVLMPAAAFVFAVAGECLPEEAAKPSKPLQRGLCALLAALTVGYGVQALDWIKETPSQWTYNTNADMDKQALSHPDLLLIYSTELVNDMRMFPDTAEGVPVNLMFWGGWQRGSPEYVARLSAFGIDPEHFTAKDWLRPEIRFISLKDAPDETLVRYLRENVGEAVCWEGEKVSEGLYFYRFYLP